MDQEDLSRTSSPDTLLLPSDRFRDSHKARARGTFMQCVRNRRDEYETFSSPRGFQDHWDHQVETEGENDRNILIMTGYPSTDWLDVVQQKAALDSAFIKSHQAYTQPLISTMYTSPQLPSTSIAHLSPQLEWGANEILLSFDVPIIGRIDPSASFKSKAEFLKVRSRISPRLQRKHRDGNNRSEHCGRSVVRGCYLLDEKRLVVDQQISITVAESQTGKSAIIWCDSGDDPVTRNDLPLDFDKELPHSGVDWNPVQMQNRFGRSMLATYTRDSVSHFIEDHQWQFERTLISSISDLLSFINASENQFLNMMKDLLSEQILALTAWQSPAPKVTLADFEYYRHILDQHVQKLEVNVRAFSTTLYNLWDEGVEDESSKRLRQRHLQDFEYMLKLSRELCGSCERGMQVLDSQRTFALTENVAQISSIGALITFIYVPLSFATAIFGMNFKIFGQGQLSIGWFFATAAITITLSAKALSRDYDLTPRALTRLGNGGARAVALSQRTARLDLFDIWRWLIFDSLRTAVTVIWHLPRNTFALVEWVWQAIRAFRLA